MRYFFKLSINPADKELYISRHQNIWPEMLEEADIKELAELISDIIIKKKDPEVMAEKVRDFKSTFNEVQYCFGKFRPYQYIELFK